jgi:hypothetical protein
LAGHNKRVADPTCYIRRLRFAFEGLQILTNCNSFERTLTELKIARAYGRLSSIPGNGPEASVILASIGNCEIRMFRDPKADIDGAPLFWLELIDHSIRTSVDSFACHRLKDAVVIVDDFISQASCLDKPDETGDR